MQGFEILKSNHAGVMVLKDDTCINYGCIEVKDNKMIYYTQKALREIFKSYNTEESEFIKELKIGKIEQRFIDSGYISIIYLNEISWVRF